MDAMHSHTINVEPTGRPRLRGLTLFSVLAALILTHFLEALDLGTVGTALPSITISLHSFNSYALVVTTQLLASITVIPIVGKLSDQFGRKWFFVAGMTLFLLGALLAGSSQNIEQLLVFRTVQGLGAGMCYILVLITVGDLFPPAERAKWQAIFGAVYGLANIIGPLLGGWLTEYGPLLGSLITATTRWRWVFYLNLPLGLLALAALLVSLPPNLSARSSHARGWAAVRRIDFAGTLLATAATSCLLLGLTWGSNRPSAWISPPVIGVLVGAAMLYPLFFIAERFAAEPIVPLDLFRNRIFAADSVLSLALGVVMICLITYLPLLAQGVLGLSPTASGALYGPLTVSMVVFGVLVGMLMRTIKRYQAITILAALVMAVGVFLLAQTTSASALVVIVIALILAGVGLGVFLLVITLVAQNALPSTRLGVGTSIVQYVRDLGGTLGVAITGTVIRLALPGPLFTHLPRTVTDRLVFTGAIGHGMLVVFVFCVAAVLATFFLKDVPMEPSSSNTPDPSGALSGREEGRSLSSL